jgi:hypothetical protein
MGLRPPERKALEEYECGDNPSMAKVEMEIEISMHDLPRDVSNSIMMLAAQITSGVITITGVKIAYL